MSGFRTSADGPLLSLALLALAVPAGLLALAARLGLPEDPLVACQTFLATVLARTANLGLLLPVALVAACALAALLALAHQIWVTRRTLRRVLTDRIEADRALQIAALRCGLGGRLDLIDADEAFTFCYGLRRARVCISRGLVELLDRDELNSVLAHEAHHLRHRDPLKILIGRSLASALFFLPLAGALRNAFLTGKELSADAAAARRGGELPLASALLKMLSAERPRWPAGVLAIGALSPTEARLLQLTESRALRPQLPTALDWGLSLACIAAIVGFVQGSAATASAAPIHAACAPPTHSAGLGIPAASTWAEPASGSDASTAVTGVDESPSSQLLASRGELLLPQDDRGQAELLLPPTSPEPCALLCQRPGWLHDR